MSDREPRSLAMTGRMPIKPAKNHTHVQISDRAVINMADTQANLSNIDVSSLSNGKEKSAIKQLLFYVGCIPT